MITHFQQIASSALLLLFGFVALRVWRRFGPVRRDRAALAWALTAANFLLVGVYATAHSLVAAAAVAMGGESSLYRFVAEWALPANLGRQLVSVAFSASLLVLLLSRRRWGPRVVALAPRGFLVIALGGTVAARVLRDTSVYTLTRHLAVLFAVTAIVLMAALLVALLYDSVDQLLWTALAVYAVKETLSVSLLAILAWWSVAQAATFFRIYFWLAFALSGVMCLLGAYRLRLAAGGRRVPAPFERLYAIRGRPAAERPL